MSSPTDRPPRATEKVCVRCLKPLPRHYVRALQATYHLDCFTCLMCGQAVANKFFPVTLKNNETYALCEKDYYRQLGLTCHKCGEPLQDAYISADNRKYHVNHFTCSVCPTTFGPEDVYYEQNGRVYCSDHYSQYASIKCVGCQLSILKQYIEISTDNIVEPWHPECYMIYKFWHVRIAPQVYSPASRHESITSVGSLDKDQIVDRAPPSLTVISEEQIYSIWTILSTFEESSAACISDMLIHVSKLRYMDALRVAEKFIFHVHIIFTAIDNLEDQLAHFDDATGLQHTKEPKFLCKRTICFFALLSHSHDLSNQGSEMAEELLSLVTGLAHYLKMLIRAALMGALKAEREYDSKVSLNGLLHKLTEINNRERLLQFRTSHQDIHVTSDMCNHCHTTLEEECIAYQRYRWHKACFNCTNCGRNLKMARQHTGFDEQSTGLLCSRCCPPNLIQPGAFQIVTQLEQYSFLLRVALRRLHSRMWERHNEVPREEHPQQPRKHLTQDDAARPYPNNASDVVSGGLPKDDGLTDKKSEIQPSPRPASALGAQPLSEKSLAEALHSSTDQARTFTEVKAKAHTRQSITGEDIPGHTLPSLDSANGSLKRKATIERHNINKEAIRLVMVDQAMSAVTSGSDLTATPSSSSVVVHSNETGSEMASGGPSPGPSTTPFRPMIIDQNSQRDRGRSFSPHHRAVGARGPGTTSPLPPAKPGTDASPVTVASSVTSSPHPVARPPPTSSVPSPMPAVPHTKPPLLCELGPMEHFLVKHVAVMRLTPLVQQYLMVDELLGMVGSRKQNFWTRLKANMNQKKKTNPKMKDSVFGASLEELLERQGVESEHATISTPVRVPLFVDMCTTAIKGKNVSVEGIFRKNGNIRRLKELSDSIDQDISSVDLSPETSVQCAALMKKFLREMAEPLLTFKLHKLFLACDRINDEVKRCQALHYACCLLPLPNRDCIEVLFGLLRFVSDQATLDGDKGNRMDLGNLATVITPNILYSSSKDPIKDDSFAAIHVVYTMMVNQDQLWTLPKDAALLLQQEKLCETWNQLSSKDILKKCEQFFQSVKPFDKASYETGDIAGPAPS